MLGKTGEDGIEISHVISWLLEQTCLQIEKFHPLWLTKGLSHTRRRLAYGSALASSDGDLNAMVNHQPTVTSLMEATKEREARTLKELYLDQSDRCLIDPAVIASCDPIARELVTEYNSIGDQKLVKDSSIHEEQEREIEFEIEAEREVERPPKISPLTPSVHNDVRFLVKYGKIPARIASTAFYPVHGVLNETTAKKLLPPKDFAPNLVVTGDFVRAVQLPRSGTTDDFLRPVRWILTSTKSDTIFAISQHEANELLPNIQTSNVVTLHIYAPRVTKDMHSFYDLDTLSITSPNRTPAKPRPDTLTSLHLFAGALYFDTHLHYRQLCDFLGVVGGGHAVKPDAKVESDGFVRPEDREGDGWEGAKFERNPLPLVKAILGMRRKGENYASTHLGRIVAGRGMHREEFE